MINIMLIAGDKTEKLSEFLIQKGTFNLEYAFNSLSEDIHTIRDSIINVDKLVYLFDKQNINIRTEMQLLKELLNDEGFFTVREILFIVTDTNESDKAIRYFKAVMSESAFVNYNINKTSEKVSFADVFDFIIGLTQAENYSNTFKDVYRVERNSDSTVAYVGDYDEGLSVEPFSYEKLSLYENAKDTFRRTESGIYRKDINSGINLETFENPDLGDLQIVNSINKIETIIVSGDRKTGVSTWASALAISAVASNKQVSLIDFTDNSDIMDTLDVNKIIYKQVSMLDMLHKYKYDENCINLVSAFSPEEQEVRTEFLQHVYTNRNSLAPIVIIAIPERLFEITYAILVNEVTRILYCINPIYSDVITKQPLISSYANDEKFFLVLNKRIELLGGFSYLETDELKNILSDDLKFIQPIDFPNLNLDDSLFNSFMGV